MTPKLQLNGVIRPAILDFALNIVNYAKWYDDLPMAVYNADRELSKDLIISKDELGYTKEYIRLNTTYNKDFVDETLNMYLSYRLEPQEVTYKSSGSSKIILFGLIGLGIVLTTTGKKNGL